METERNAKQGERWNVCGFATDELKRIEMTEEVSERNLEIVRIQDSWEKKGVEIGYKFGKYA